MAEVAVLTATLAVSTALPRADGAGSRLESRSEAWLDGAARLFASETLFTSVWFLLLVLLSMSSLSLVLSGQVRRAWRLSRNVPTPAGLDGAPFRRAEVFRSSTGELPGTEVRVRGSLGSWGSPLLHLGLLLVMLAGLLRMLFGADALVELIVGETLSPRPDAWAAQWPGLLARPYAFPVPLRLEELHVSYHKSGETKGAEGSLRLSEGAGSETRRIAINQPIRMGVHYLYLRSIGGAATLLVVVPVGSPLERHAILLRDTTGGTAGQVTLADGTLLRIAANGGGFGRLPERVELRALRDGALVGLAQLSSSQVATLHDGTRIRVAGIVPWAELTGRRDISTPVVYAGFFFACAGGLLLAAVVRVESAVIFERVESGTRLTVLMRPQRFEPLYAPAFDRLWDRAASRIEGGTERLVRGRS